MPSVNLLDCGTLGHGVVESNLYCVPLLAQLHPCSQIHAPYSCTNQHVSQHMCNIPQAHLPASSAGVGLWHPLLHDLCAYSCFFWSKLIDLHHEDCICQVQGVGKYVWLHVYILSQVIHATNYAVIVYSTPQTSLVFDSCVYVTYIYRHKGPWLLSDLLLML